MAHLGRRASAGIFCSVLILISASIVAPILERRAFFRRAEGIGLGVHLEEVVVVLGEPAWEIRVYMDRAPVRGPVAPLDDLALVFPAPEPWWSVLGRWIQDSVRSGGAGPGSTRTLPPTFHGGRSVFLGFRDSKTMGPALRSISPEHGCGFRFEVVPVP